MEFTKFDFVIVLTMSVAIVSLSFTLPALGLTDAGTDENDIPSFDMSADRFDFAGDFPDQPGSPSQGVLEGEPDTGDNIFLDGDTSGGTELVALHDNDTGEVDVSMYDWDAGSSVGETNTTLTELGDTGEFEDFGYVVEVEWVADGSDARTDQFQVEYQITEQESDQAWLTRVPVVGGIISTGQQLASIVAWIGSIIYWGTLTMFQIAINLIWMLFDTLLFAFDAVTWLITTYNDVISSAGSWAAIFVAIPGLLLFFEFVKIVWVGLGLLPTT